MDIAPIIVFIGTLIFLAHLFAGIFRRARIPDVLFLFVIGLVLGPVMGIVTPETFGIAGPVFTTITLVFILFESGTDLRFDALRHAFRGTASLTALNFLTTMAAVGAIVQMFTDLSPLTAFMLGAIVGGTSSAVVVPLVQQLNLRPHSAAILILESSFSDVFTIVIPLALIEAFKRGEVHLGFMGGQMILAFIAAVLLGVGGAFAWSTLLNKVRTLRNAIFTTPAFVFVIFGLAEMLGYSGPIAALAFGATLGNVEHLRVPLLERYTPHEPVALIEIERAFFSEVVFLLKTFFFVYIGISIQVTHAAYISLGLILTLAMFLIRLPVVRLTAPRSTPPADAARMAVMIPKGLGAAVLASIPLQRGVPGGELIQHVTFSIILFTTIFTTILIFLQDRTALLKSYERLFHGFGRPDEPIGGP